MGWLGSGRAGPSSASAGPAPPTVPAPPDPRWVLQACTSHGRAAPWPLSAAGGARQHADVLAGAGTRHPWCHSRASGSPAPTSGPGSPHPRSGQGSPPSGDAGSSSGSGRAELGVKGCLVHQWAEAHVHVAQAAATPQPEQPPHKCFGVPAACGKRQQQERPWRSRSASSKVAPLGARSPQAAAPPSSPTYRASCLGHAPALPLPRPFRPLHSLGAAHRSWLPTVPTRQAFWPQRHPPPQGFGTKTSSVQPPPSSSSLESCSNTLILGTRVLRCWLLSFFLLFRPYLEHMEVPRPRAESQLQLPAHTTARAWPWFWATDPIACGNARLLMQWASPGIEPASSQTLCQVLNSLSHSRNSSQLLSLQFFKFYICFRA